MRNIKELAVLRPALFILLRGRVAGSVYLIAVGDEQQRLENLIVFVNKLHVFGKNIVNLPTETLRHLSAYVAFKIQPFKTKRQC